MIDNNVFDTLKTKREELFRRISAIESDLKKGRSQAFAEQTTESENDQVLNGIRHEAKIELRLVNEALQRLEQNQYGICSKCEKKINPKRLHALPYINTCIRCAS